MLPLNTHVCLLPMRFNYTEVWIMYYNSLKKLDQL